MSKSPKSPAPKLENADHNVLQDGIPPFPSKAHKSTSKQPSTPASASSIRNATPTGRSSSRRRRAAPASALTDLQALPEIRPIPWIPGRELPPDKSTDSPRTQTKGAFMLLTRGEIKNPPCTHCTTGAGRFSACVALEPFFFGACATCQMATRGHLCSLRSDEDESPSATKPPTATSAVPTPAHTPTPSNEEHQAHNALKRKIEHLAPSPHESQRRTSNPSNSIPHSSDNPNINHVDSIPQPMPAPQPTSGFKPINGPPSSQQSESQFRPINNQAPNTQNESQFRPINSPMMHHHHHGAPYAHPSQHPAQHHAQHNPPRYVAAPSQYPVQRNGNHYMTVPSQHAAPPNGPHYMASADHRHAPQYVAVPSQPPVQHNGQYMAVQSQMPTRPAEQQYQDRPSQRKSTSGETVIKQETARRSHFAEDNKQSSNGGERQEVDLRELLSPTPPSDEYVAPTKPEIARAPVSPAMIDALPRKKQKQIFGIIGGLQSGIRSIHQQADHLQKQLDLLQASLGIDDEDDLPC